MGRSQAAKGHAMGNPKVPKMPDARQQCQRDGEEEALVRQRNSRPECPVEGVRVRSGKRVSASDLVACEVGRNMGDGGFGVLGERGSKGKPDKERHAVPCFFRTFGNDQHVWGEGQGRAKEGQGVDWGWKGGVILA